MSHYYLNVSVLRDELAEHMADNMTQTPYVLAQIAKRTKPGTWMFGYFVEQFSKLSDDEQTALLDFCQELVASLSKEPKP